MKTYLGECSLKVTRPNDECSKILVSNPDWPFLAYKRLHIEPDIQNHLGYSEIH